MPIQAYAFFVEVSFCLAKYGRRVGVLIWLYLVEISIKAKIRKRSMHKGG